MAKKSVKAEEPKVSWMTRFGTFATVLSSLFSVLILLFFVALLLPSLLSKVQSASANVAIIQINGEIVSDGGGFGQSTTTSTDVVQYLKDAQDDNAIKAVILEINSPGGTPVATEEIANELKKVNKTTVAVIRESGTSGAYWVASATNRIFASRLSVTGSIGVLASYVDFSGFMQDHNITYNRLVGGQYKDVGSPFTPLTGEERDLMQKLVDRMHGEFIDAVAANRHMQRKDVEQLANGFVYLGVEAQQLGLVDELGGMDEALAYIEKQIGQKAETVTYSAPPTFLQALAGAVSQQSFHVGEGIGSALFNQRVQGTTPQVFT
jgi:protease-4